jgi:hypothetical protein
MRSFNYLPNLVKLAAPQADYVPKLTTGTPQQAQNASKPSQGFGVSFSNAAKNAPKTLGGALSGTNTNLKDMAGEFSGHKEKIMPSITYNGNVGPFKSLEFNPMMHQKSTFSPKADYYNGQFMNPINTQNPYGQDSVEFTGPMLRGTF